VNKKAFHKYLLRKKRSPRAIMKYMQLVSEFSQYLEQSHEIKEIKKAQCFQIEEFLFNYPKKRDVNILVYARSILYYYERLGRPHHLSCMEKVLKKLK